MLIVGLALAPLALASIIQAVLNFNAYQGETNRILVQTALYAAYNEQSIFTRAESLLQHSLFAQIAFLLPVTLR
jgi:hypothetical protein